MGKAKMPTSLLSKRLIAALAVASLLVAVIAITSAFLYAETFIGGWSRFWLCILVGLSTSIFFYVLFPAYTSFSIPLDRSGILGPKVLVGPLAIWFFVTGVCWYVSPGTRGGVYFVSGQTYDAKLINFNGWSPTQPTKYFQLVDPVARTLVGIYIESDSLVPTYNVTPTLGEPTISKFKPIEFTVYIPGQKFTLERERP